jgi:hypothetical protein
MGSGPKSGSTKRIIDQDNQASVTVATKIGMAFEKEGKVEIGPR